MDYSTTVEKLDNITIQSLSLDEMIEKYTSLKSQFESLGRQYEGAKQELHDARKNNQFLSDLKSHLSSEIESWQKNEAKMKQDHNQKLQILHEELEALRLEKWKEAESFTSAIESLNNKIKALEEAQHNTSEEKSVTSVDNSKLMDELKRIDDENIFMKDLINEQKKELVENENLIGVLKNQVNNLEEQVESLKCNLDMKKNEVLSVTDMLHSAQEELFGANAELQNLKNATNTHAVKGNSLFAEVDDKRQEMLKSLAQMKDKVYQLNRELISKQAEIDSLICEKKTLWEEYAGQSNHHDAVLNRAYERRITDLEKQNDQLQREIARWYEKNLDAASSDVTQWVAGVLDYYKEENHRLSNEFAASSVDNLFKEQKLRDLQRQLVTWRTKAIEANATVSELETKLQVKDSANQSLMHRQDFKPIDKTPIKEHNRKNSKEASIVCDDKENIVENKANDDNILKDSNAKPGILVTGTDKKKVIKKTTFQ